MASNASADDLKYQKTMNRINKIRTDLNKFVTKHEKTKWIGKIYRYLDTIEEEVDPKQQELLYLLPIGDVDEFIFDRDSCSIESCHPVTVQVLQTSAEIAIGYFNRNDRPPNTYYVVDLIRATKYWGAGYVLDLTFTAKNESSVEEAETFETTISYRFGATEVQFVKKMLKNVAT